MIKLNIKFNFSEKRGAIMEKVSILEFRRDAETVIRQVRQGKRFILTYRGKPVMRLEPIRECEIGPDDPFYSIAEYAVDDDEPPLTNEEIDRVVYGV
jgi:prevent-host-death family protein